MRPNREDEVRDIVADALRRGEALDIKGGGSKTAIGAPRPDARVLDMTGMSGIVDYDPAELVLTVRPGTPLAELKAPLAEHGQMLAFDPYDHGPLFGAAGFQTFIRYMEIVALYSLFMTVTSSDQPGTDFTILACAQMVVYLVGSLISGKLADLMGYGALLGLAAAGLFSSPYRFDGEPSFLLSLGYLAFFASVIGFGSYLTLVQRIGADRAAYASVLFPLLALLLSTLFEGYRWTMLSGLGILLVLAGNLLVLLRPQRLPAPAAPPTET